MSKLPTMEILRLASLVLPFWFYSVFCFPTRPLNERSTELAWQAWLLVDDQNQNKHYDPEVFTRRRITPKSVFIAPTFSPESLPACAEGYSPDSMGRCIKIIKLNEEAHLDFLLEKLNAQFGNYDEVEDESESEQDMPTTGPLQLNIPLQGEGEQQDQDRPGDNLDIAIVVAPTNGNFKTEDDAKFTIKATSTQKKIPGQRHPAGSSSKRKTEPKVPGQAEPTTLMNDDPTALDDEASSTQIPDTTTPVIQTTSTEPTTPYSEVISFGDQHALFFLEPPSVSDNKNTFNAVAANLTNIALRSDIAVNTSVTVGKRPADSGGSQIDSAIKDPAVAEDANFKPSGFVRFPSEESTTDASFPLRITYNKLHSNSNLYASQFQHSVQPSPSITFPDDPPPMRASEQFSTLFDDYVHSRGPDLKASERFVFKNQDPARDRTLPSGHHVNRHSLRSPSQYDLVSEHVFNHRNRDKSAHLWSLPSSWSESSPQKPIVLRFSSRAGGSRHLLEEHLLPRAQNSQAFYREVPSEDFSYIFGIPQSHNQRRHRR